MTTRTIAVTGASGLLGSALAEALRRDGGEVRRLVRRPPASDDEVRWDPGEGVVQGERLEGLDAVVHLAGEPIAGGRWTAAKKRRIEESRIAGTRLLADALAGLERPPRTLVAASAMGYYGDRGDEVLQEGDPPGESFLARVCVGWEEATRPAADAGIRVVNLRWGMILDRDDGALAQMLTPFRLGLGGPVGPGDQWWSWISRDDAVGVVRHALATPSLEGPVNAVSPHPETSRTFARTLGRVLHRPAVLPLPTFAARLLLGEMADELLLASARLDAGRLAASGFTHRHPGLEAALRSVLGR